MFLNEQVSERVTGVGVVRACVHTRATPGPVPSRRPKMTRPFQARGNRRSPRSVSTASHLGIVHPGRSPSGVPVRGQRRKGLMRKGRGTMTSAEGRRCCRCGEHDITVFILDKVFAHGSSRRNNCFPVVCASSSSAGHEVARAESKGRFALEMGGMRPARHFLRPGGSGPTLK